VRTPRLVVIGASAGGLRALSGVLGGLTRDFPAPIAVVQHRHALLTDDLAQLLARRSLLRVVDAEDKRPLERGLVAIAPPDYHLLVERIDDSAVIALSTEAPVNHSRPSIDVLFESAALAFGDAVVSVVLTGSTADGARGAVAIKASGGQVIIEDPSTAEAGAMPAAVAQATRVDLTLPLDAIAPALEDLARRRREGQR
jgi:two-component system chemotaxis response regulator CheB